MKVLGIIAEYNPFHNGHLYQMQKSIEATKADFVVAIMSGNFTQRGDLAIFSKWTRAEAAIQCGIDLVIELPFVFACNNAEYFAKGAIEILNRLGCITHLSFGSESGNLEVLKHTAAFLAREPKAFQEKLKESLSLGVSYPRARAQAMRRCIGDEHADVLDNPNNILAVEYLKQLHLTNSDITPITVKRYAADYHDLSLSGAVASASAIRTALNVNERCREDLLPFIPSQCKHSFETAAKQYCFDSYFKLRETAYFKMIAAKIIVTPKEDLRQIFSMGEGLENKLYSALRLSDDLPTLKEQLKSKRYTATRISRLLTHLLLNMTKEDFHKIIQEEKYYARILGFNQNGTKLLKHMKKSTHTEIPCITNINKEYEALAECQNILNFDLKSSDLYNLILDRNIYAYADQIQSPYCQL